MILTTKIKRRFGSILLRYAFWYKDNFCKSNNRKAMSLARNIAFEEIYQTACSFFK